jgi:hypothetical protein
MSEIRNNNTFFLFTFTNILTVPNMICRAVIAACAGARIVNRFAIRIMPQPQVCLTSVFALLQLCDDTVYNLVHKKDVRGVKFSFATFYSTRGAIFFSFSMCASNGYKNLPELIHGLCHMDPPASSISKTLTHVLLCGTSSWLVDRFIWMKTLKHCSTTTTSSRLSDC